MEILHPHPLLSPFLSKFDWQTVVGDTPKIYFSMLVPRRWSHVKLLRTRPLLKMQDLETVVACRLGRSVAGAKLGAYRGGGWGGIVTHPA